MLNKKTQVSQTKTSVRREYNRLASIYDRRWRDYLDRSLSFLLDFTEIPPQAAILDLACGTGELAKLILKTNPQQAITGVDISPAMLAIAKNKLQAYPQVELANASATALPFERQFDIVVCANAWHYFADPEIALAEIKRVIKPNGKIYILDWCRDYFVLKLLNPLFKSFDSAYQQCYTQKELEELLMVAGFEVVEDSKMRFGFIWELIALDAKSILK